MMKTRKDDPINLLAGPQDGYTRQYPEAKWGLTKREYFAAQIMSSAMYQVHYESFCYEECAKAAVLLADALIEALNK